ncbi:MAG TPA: hypothetical protein VKD71_06150 [Gemmataceae bacterium]|nr:hypothetical protein [Gemmataceae bacterium]
MAKNSTKTARSTMKASAKVPSSRVVYLLGKGTSQVLDARVNREEIHLLVNGPGMLYGSGRLLTSLDMVDGATFQAWTQLAAALTCTSYCGHNGKTDIPIQVETSRIGTCLAFSLGPMAMYQSQVVLRPKKQHKTMRDTIAEAFGRPKKSYAAVIVPEAATGHAEHDASIFEPPPAPGDHHHDHS